MKKVCTIIFVLIVAVVIAFFYADSASATTIKEGYVGIVLNWGKAEADVLTPGFYLIPPWKSVVKMDCRWQKYEVVCSAFSKDIQQVDIKMTCNYKLSEDGARRIYSQVGEDYGSKIMEPCILDAVKAVFSKYTAEELISERGIISSEVYETIYSKMEIYDVKIKDVAITDIDFSDAFTDAVEAKQVATQKKLQTQTEQEQQTIIAEAEAEREKIKAQADAEKKKIAAEADAEAVRIQADAESYRLEVESKNITDKVIQKEYIKKWNGQLPIISGGSATPIVNMTELLNGEK
jgi:regulator of protease activity HflC (stomatin/prohibitin superfamily)